MNNGSTRRLLLSRFLELRVDILDSFHLVQLRIALGRIEPVFEPLLEFLRPGQRSCTHARVDGEEIAHRVSLQRAAYITDIHWGAVGTPVDDGEPHLGGTE